jgi:hypothetical protein
VNPPNPLLPTFGVAAAPVTGDTAAERSLANPVVAEVMTPAVFALLDTRTAIIATPMIAAATDVTLAQNSFIDLASIQDASKTLAIGLGLPSCKFYHSSIKLSKESAIVQKQDDDNQY